LLDLLDELLAAGDDPGLWAAEQFVAAEEDEIDPRRDTLPHDRLTGEAEAPEVEKRPAADVVDDGKIVLLAERHEVGEIDTLGEAGDAVIARVDLHQRAGGGTDRLLVVGETCDVGGADLAQRGAADGHDVGDAEAA